MNVTKAVTATESYEKCQAGQDFCLNNRKHTPSELQENKYLLTASRALNDLRWNVIHLFWLVVVYNNGFPDCGDDTTGMHHVKRPDCENLETLSVKS